MTSPYVPWTLLPLLRPFDLEKAKAGEAIRWSNLETPCTFLGKTDGGKIAVMTARGAVELVVPSDLRMKPLFWHEDKPVYKGDKLWHEMVRGWVEVDCLQVNEQAEENGWFRSALGHNYAKCFCTWEDKSLRRQPLLTIDGKEVFAGDKVWHTLDKRYITLKGPSSCDDVEDTDGIGRSACFLRLEEPKPLFVLDGKPVYKGNKLWDKSYQDYCVVECMQPIPEREGVYFFYGITKRAHRSDFCLWKKPAKTRHTKYANVYDGYIGKLFDTIEEAREDDVCRFCKSIAKITWEE